MDQSDGLDGTRRIGMTEKKEYLNLNYATVRSLAKELLDIQLGSAEEAKILLQDAKYHNFSSLDIAAVEEEIDKQTSCTTDHRPHWCDIHDAYKDPMSSTCTGHPE